MYPWPGCRVRVLAADGSESNRLTLVRARAYDENGDATSGSITSAGRVATGGGGAIEIIELQPEGKRPMPLQSYRNGHPWLPGMRLEPIA